MKYDSLIIGGGIAGLSCALRCQQAGMSTAVITAGQSAMHFSSGSIDLLSRLPQGQKVTAPYQALEQLIQQAPRHPYSKLGSKQIEQALSWYQDTLQQAGIPLLHQEEKINHLRLTPLGTFRETFLSQESVYPFPLKLESHGLKSIALVTIQGFRDFQPELAADNLSKLDAFKHTELRSISLRLSALETLQRNPCELRSIELSRLLREEQALEQFARELRQRVGQADLVVLPAIFGNGDGLKVLRRLSELSGYRLSELPTMPPSLLGIRIEETMKQHFVAGGGTLLRGDEVTGGEFEEQQLKAVYTRNYREIPLRADHFLLASGSFFSHGLKTSFNRIFEPVFGLDINQTAQRSDWYREEFFSPNSHPFLGMGVETNGQLQAQREGNTIDNLYCAGAILAHYNPVFEGSGSGVAISSGFAAAEQMIKLSSNARSAA
ncbi:glycerol-3-phosphate dehydrogenase subunit GlpB [Dongshaea marina]|uniref:glycerol-3-phosphate dehydrogenase subunit GlpB n=1 Tax=Dongshaea marina TaxID=2047966 RepID=UPI000D3E2CDA|nr:glycerol-3-phosphate dehydrogenase subunit GlpB [Dongshaea marina]